MQSYTQHPLNPTNSSLKKSEGAHLQFFRCAFDCLMLQFTVSVAIDTEETTCPERFQNLAHLMRDTVPSARN